MSRIIEIPDWCVVGSYIEWNAPEITGVKWVREKIIGYREGGFLHQAVNCPIYFTEFDEYGKTVRKEKPIVSNVANWFADLVMEQQEQM